MQSELQRIKAAMAAGEHTDGDLAEAVEQWEAALLKLGERTTERDLVERLDTAVVERDEWKDTCDEFAAYNKELKGRLDSLTSTMAKSRKTLVAEHVEMKRQRDFVVRQRDELQARLDALMLEYCPAEMTPEQVAEWERNQRPVVEKPTPLEAQQEKTAMLRKALDGLSE